jgi:hypothetical protein
MDSNQLQTFEYSVCQPGSQLDSILLNGSQRNQDATSMEYAVTKLELANSSIPCDFVPKTLDQHIFGTNILFQHQNPCVRTPSSSTTQQQQQRLPTHDTNLPMRVAKKQGQTGIVYSDHQKRTDDLKNGKQYSFNEIQDNMNRPCSNPDQVDSENMKCGNDDLTFRRLLDFALQYPTSWEYSVMEPTPLP